MSIPEGEKKPPVTVITVVYNGAAHLEETIRSVQSLDYDNIAHMVVDGGSTDGTVDLIRKYESQLVWWISEPDHGIYDAMNKGWAAASPDSYILFLGAGDIISSLPAHLGEFRPHEVPYGDVQLEGRLFRGAAGFGLRCNNTLHHQALLVPKLLHPEPPFDTRFKVYADFDFNLRLLKSGARFVHAPEFRAAALPGGVSSRKAHGETLRIVRKNYGLAGCALALVYLVLKKLLKKGSGLRG
jgi:glycosyltransferase involved in cell wall biosynthesis